MTKRMTEACRRPTHALRFHHAVTSRHYREGIQPTPQTPMFIRSPLIRIVAIPACLVWGLMEFIALQRAHKGQRKLRQHQAR